MKHEGDGEGGFLVPLLVLGMIAAGVLIYYCVKALVLMEGCG